MPVSGGPRLKRCFPGTVADTNGFLRIFKKIQKGVRQISGIRNPDAATHGFQDLFRIQKILHMGSIKDGFSPYRRFQRVLPAQGNQTGAAEHKSCNAVNVEQFAKGIDYKDFGGSFCFPRPDFRSQLTFKPTGANQGENIIRPLDMPGRQD